MSAAFRKGNGKRRCEWASLGEQLYRRYHDEEWGVPVHDDPKLFEFLILEGAQAGLSWSTILKKRENFRKAFENFRPRKVAMFDEQKVKDLMSDTGIIRNELKIRSAIQNARMFLEVQKEFGSFDSFAWKFVGNRPKINRWRSMKDIPATTPESEGLSKELKRRGFKFVGSTICYAFMQAVGMVNDHAVYCFRFKELATAQ